MQLSCQSGGQNETSGTLIQMLRGILVRIKGVGMGAERVKNRSIWV